MPAMTSPADGGCLCGSVGFRLTSSPLCTIACHCTGCQHMTASAFSLTVMMPTAGFALTRGQPVLGALHRAESQHWHCPECLAWLYTSFTPDGGFINVRATALDDVRWFVPFVETMAAEKLPWVTLPVQRSYPGWPPAADLPELLQAFAVA